MKLITPFTKLYSALMELICPHGINNHPHEIVKRPHEINKTANEFTGSFDTDNAP